MKLESPVPADILAAIQAPFLETPAHTLDAPVLQPLDLLLDLAGETLRERLFVVQGNGGPETCLRTDFTLPALRAHIESGRPSGRYFYAGHAFRVAPPGTDRAEEFLQVGVEAFEAGDAAIADARMAALAWRAAAAGGRNDLTLLMGDIGLFSSPRRLRAELSDDAAGEAPQAAAGDRLAARLAGLSEKDAAAVLEDVWALAGIEPVGGRSAAEIVHRLAERASAAGAARLTSAQKGLIKQFLAIADAPQAALAAAARLAGAGRPALDAASEDWSRRLAALSEAGVPADRIRFSAAFGRPFGYYDGVLFEVRGAALGEDQPAAAGGRYDGLPIRLGATLATGAVGCMVRPGRAWSGAA